VFGKNQRKCQIPLRLGRDYYAKINLIKLNIISKQIKDLTDHVVLYMFDLILAKLVI